MRQSPTCSQIVQTPLSAPNCLIYRAFHGLGRLLASDAKQSARFDRVILIRSFDVEDEIPIVDGDVRLDHVIAAAGIIAFEKDRLKLVRVDEIEKIALHGVHGRGDHTRVLGEAEMHRLRGKLLLRMNQHAAARRLPVDQCRGAQHGMIALSPIHERRAQAARREPVLPLAPSGMTANVRHETTRQTAGLDRSPSWCRSGLDGSRCSCSTSSKVVRAAIVGLGTSLTISVTAILSGLALLASPVMAAVSLPTACLPLGLQLDRSSLNPGISHFADADRHEGPHIRGPEDLSRSLG